MKKLVYLSTGGIGVIAVFYAIAVFLPFLTEDNEGAAQVVLLHGLGRSESAMLLLESHLLDAGFDVYNFGYPSNDQPPGVLVDMVSAEIDSCCAGNDRTMHLVGHSLGGLLIRAYLVDRRPTNLGRVVLLGSPNKGSELADESDAISTVLLDLAGPAARALGTGEEDFAAGLPPPDFPVGVIAGTRDNPVSNQWLPLPNDGMVSVESARLEGMTDFTEFNVTHWGLRNDGEVADQVVFFLNNEHFRH